MATNSAARSYRPCAGAARRDHRRMARHFLRPTESGPDPVYSYADLLKDPQVRHNGSFVTYDHPTEGTVTTPGFPWKFSKTPPVVGRPSACCR